VGLFAWGLCIEGLFCGPATRRTRGRRGGGNDADATRGFVLSRLFFSFFSAVFAPPLAGRVWGLVRQRAVIYALAAVEFFRDGAGARAPIECGRFLLPRPFHEIFFRG
jgi:hypothetical protein